MVSTVLTRFRRAVCAVSLACVAATGVASPAAADVPPPPVKTFDAHRSVRVDQDRISYSVDQYWFDTYNHQYYMNLVTPYPGNEVRCWHFHGVNYECWQADNNGEFHKLTASVLSFVTPTAHAAGREIHNTYFFPGTYTGVAATRDFWEAVVERPFDFFPWLTEWVLDPRNVEAVNTWAPLLLPVFKTTQKVSDTVTSTESSWYYFRSQQFSS